MTIIEAINRIDTLVPNRYELVEKVRWLSTLDGIIKAELIDTHEVNDVDFSGYNENTNLNTVLLVPAPYDQIYIFWLESQIDYWNKEMGKYNNSIIMYNTAYSDYEKYYNRTHMPRGKKYKFF